MCDNYSFAYYLLTYYEYTNIKSDFKTLQLDIKWL